MKCNRAHITQTTLYICATKAVSLVPAAYYTDLACERGRCYINDFLNMADDKTSSAGMTKEKGKAKYDRDEEKAKVFKAAEEAWGEGLSRTVCSTFDPVDNDMCYR